MQVYTSGLAEQRRSPVPSAPLSALDALRKDSIRLAASMRDNQFADNMGGPVQRRQQGRENGGVLPVRGSSIRGKDAHRPFPLELNLAESGGKGKGRAAPQDYTSDPDGEVVFAYPKVANRNHNHQHSSAPYANIEGLSPLRTHAFSGSVASLMTNDTMLESLEFDASDQDSPIVPDCPGPSASRASSRQQDDRSASAQSTYTSNSTQSGASGDTFGVPQITRKLSLSRNPSARRYAPPTVNPEDETESLQGDRSTWHSEWDQRDYIRPAGGMPRESTMTVESADGDPFHYSKYESLPSPNSFKSDPSVPLSSRQTSPVTSISTSSTPSSPPPPIVRIGPPSPVSPEFPLPPSPLPYDSRKSPQPSFAGASIPGHGFLIGSPRTPDSAPSSITSPLQPSNAGRLPSQTMPRNFSRPLQPVRPSESVESHDENGQSSLDHSSQGAHSLSSSWEGRLQYEVQQLNAQKAATRQIAQTQAPPSPPAESPAPFTQWMHPSRPAPRPLDTPSFSPPLHTPSSSFYQTTPNSPSSSFHQIPPTSQASFYHSPSGTQLSSFPPQSEPPHAPNDRADVAYRLDSYYASADSDTSPIPVFSHDELKERRSRPSSPPRQRNVLRKPRPPDHKQSSSRDVHQEEGGGLWGRFRSKSRTRKSSHTDESESNYSQEGSVIAFGSSPDEFGRTETRDNPFTRSGGAKSSVGSSRSGYNANSLSPGWPLGRDGYGSDDVERLDDSEHHPTSMMVRSASDLGPARLPREPDTNRPPSLYSNYSFYSLPPDDGQLRSASREPSPRASPNSSTTTFLPLSNNSTMSTLVHSNSIAKAAKARSRTAPVLTRSPSGKLEPQREPETPDDFLQLGIDFHEQGELERAAWYFEQSAKRNGGCIAGLVMWGLTLRHGWGCQVNPQLGFRYLQNAAESVVKDLDRLVADGGTLSANEFDTKAVKNELVLALYEMGTSFRLGLGVEKDKKMAVSYFELAANLGDPDAQRDLAFCYANGKGCKKDMKMAAKYYRMAVAQGGESFGLSWIYKPKYMDAEEPGVRH